MYGQFGNLKGEFEVRRRPFRDMVDERDRAGVTARLYAWQCDLQLLLDEMAEWSDKDLTANVQAVMARSASRHPDEERRHGVEHAMLVEAMERLTARADT